jgi:starvation-inducible DNA-binding protein
MPTTKNDLPQTTRSKVNELCASRVADAIDLAYQAKQAHWNVKGPSFFALHELFDKVADEARDYADTIAERIVQLGGIVEGTIRAAAKRSSLPEYPLSALDQTEHVQALSSALAGFGKAARAAIDQCDELRDRDSADLFTEISRGVDKLLWMVEAHLPAK